MAVPQQQILRIRLSQEPIYPNGDVHVVLNRRVLEGLVDKFQVDECNNQTQVHERNAVMVLCYRKRDDCRCGDEGPVLHREHVVIALVDERKRLREVLMKYFDWLHLFPNG